MKTRDCSERRFFGFTLMEMVGVVAVVGILATLLVPRIMAAIADADLAADVLSIKSVRSAAEDYFRRYGKFAGVGGAAVSWTNNNAYENWDQKVLLPEQLLEKPFVSRLATNASVRLVNLVSVTPSTPTLNYGNDGSIGTGLGNNGAYDLLREYAANSMNDGDASAYAQNATPPAPHSASWAALCAVSSWRPIAAGILDQSWRWASSLGSQLRSGANAALVQTLAPRRSVRWLDLLHGTGLSPLKALGIPFKPISTPPPSPGLGTIDYPGSSSPSHSGPPLPAQNTVAVAGSAPPPVVVEIALQGVSIADAYRLSLAIDGPSQSNWAYWDSQGRVKYDFNQASVGTVFIYLASK